MKNFHVRHLWLALGAYGVWFAIFSGFEEISRGKYGKFLLSLSLGFLVYFIFELKSKK